MTPNEMLLLSLLHPLMAILTISVNQALNQRRGVASSGRDRAKFRLALATELANLRDLCKDNVDAIYAGRDALASCRIFSAIYRANLGRIHILSADDIPVIVNAYAMSERVEAYAAATCKAHGANAYSLGKDRAFTETLVAKYEMSAAAVERALRALGAVEAEALGAREEATRLAAA